MSGVSQLVHGTDPSNDRRQHARLRALTLTYAELDQENGGIVLDASEGGISVHAVVPLTDVILPKLRLKLPESGWLETRARVVWTRDSGKVAGLQFEELSNEGQEQIRAWLSSEARAPETIEIADSAIPGLEVATVSTIVAQEFPQRDRSEAAQGSADATVAAAAPIRHPTSFPALEVSPSPVSPSEWAKAAVPASPRRISKFPFLSKGVRQTASSIYLLLLALAVASLASGWAAGTGKIGPLFAKVRASVRPAMLDGRVAASQSVLQPSPVNDIEILDSNNQQRTISLLGASSDAPHPAPAAPEKPAAAKNATVSSDKPRLNFQIWTLTAPQASSAYRTSNSSRSAAPPDVEGYSGAPQISSIGSAPIEATGPQALPKPTISTGVLKRGALIRKVDPEYPQIAQEQHISGTVTLNATIGADGKVRDVHVISGSKLLVQPAVNAVRQWRYTPTLLDGKAIQTQVQISLVFGQPSE